MFNSLWDSLFAYKFDDIPIHAVISCWAIAFLGGKNSTCPSSPFTLPCNALATSCRGNHLASSNSILSIVMSVVRAYAMQPIMSCDGMGQGWDEWYWTLPTLTPLSSKTSLLTASSMVSPVIKTNLRYEKLFFLEQIC